VYWIHVAQDRVQYTNVLVFIYIRFDKDRRILSAEQQLASQGPCSIEFVISKWRSQLTSSLSNLIGEVIYFGRRAHGI
jgi:hypothetical protein